MTKKQKLLSKLLSGSRNIDFSDMQKFMEGFGFKLARVSGSHYIYSHPEVPELVNLQNVNGQAKPYQVRQFFALIERYNLQMEDEE